MANKAYKMPQADYEELTKNQDSESECSEELKQWKSLFNEFIIQDSFLPLRVNF